MASSKIEMDDYENTTRREEQIYDQIGTNHGNIKKDLELNLSMTKWLQFVLLPLLTVSLLSVGLILTVVYVSMYGELKVKMEKNYACLKTKQNISAAEIHALLNEVKTELEVKMEKNYAFLMTKQNISGAEIHALVNEVKTELEVKMEKNYAFLMTKQNISGAETHALVNEVKSYEEMVKKQDPVAFVAYRKSSQRLSNGTIIVFDHVWTNVGNGYQPSSGIFTAPRVGLYHLSAVVLSGNGKQLFVQLSHNKEFKSGSWVTGDGRKTGTLNVVLSLQKGDEVCIVASDSDTIYSDGNAYITFSGYSIT